MPDGYLAIIPLVVYLVIITSVGYLSRSWISWNDFFLADRRVGTFHLTGSLIATILGASSTIGLVGLSYSKGLPGAWWLLSGVLGLSVLSALSYRVRSTGARTLPDLIGIFYGRTAEKAAALLILVAWTGVIAAQIVAAGRLLGAIFGHESIWMVATSIALIAYTAYGGQRAVIRTDLLQLSLILLGVLLIFIICLKSAPDALNALDFPTSEGMAWKDVLSLVVIVGSMYVIGPDIYSRILSSENAGCARNAVIFSAMIIVPVAFLLAALGVFASHLLPGIRAEDALPRLMIEILPSQTQGLIAAAFLAAVMSSADTSLLTATAILTANLGIGSGIRGRRIAALSIGLISLMLALSRPEIIATLMFSYTIFTGGFLFPVVAGFYRDKLRLTPNSAIAALLAGGTTSLLIGGSYPLAGIFVSAQVMLIVSFIERKMHHV